MIKAIFKREDYIPPIMALLIAGIVLTIGTMRYTGFGTSYALLNLVLAFAWLGIAAAGMTFVILSGGIDLSAGSMIAFTSVFVAVLVERWGVPPALAIVIGGLTGALAGAAMGSLIHFYQLPAFMVTLGGLFLFRSLAFALSEWTDPQHVANQIQIVNQQITHWNDISISFGRGNGRLSLQAMVMIVVFVVAGVVAHFTRFGRNVYAIGGDEQAAKLMGVPIGRTKILIYALSGFCSAIAGVMSMLNKSSGNPAEFVGAELDVITAVVLGGTLLTGGSGYIFGTICGVFVIGLIQNLIDYEGLLGAWPRIIMGAMLLAAILSQRALSKLTGGRTTAHA
ncbi:MAG: hypothetical protein QM770_09715 [Tepidisphaeraceae bacterium]